MLPIEPMLLVSPLKVVAVVVAAVVAVVAKPEVANGLLKV